MQLPSIRRDPTPFLVLGLVLVIGALFVARLLVGGTDPGDGTRATDGDPAPSSTPPTGAPGEGADSPTVTPTSPRPDKPRRSPRGAPPPLGLDLGEEQCVETGISSDVTALSYNIKSGQGAGTLPQIADVMRRSGADVILLQEVDRLRFASGRVDQPAYFSEQLDMPFAFGKNVPHAGGGAYGTAILSRYPILSVENTFLPRPGTTQQRGLLHAVIDVEGIEVSVYNTHLQNGDEPARMQQVAAMNAATADDRRPRILGGDMNAPPGSGPMNVLSAQWTDTWNVVGSGSGRTAPSGTPRARIDYLLHAGAGVTPLGADVLTSFASDHRPVRAAYRIDQPGEPICLPGLD